MIVTISWRGNNDRQQRFDLMENALYINPIIIIIIIVIKIFYPEIYLNGDIFVIKVYNLAYDCQKC